MFCASSNWTSTKMVELICRASRITAYFLPWGRRERDRAVAITGLSGSTSASTASWRAAFWDGGGPTRMAQRQRDHTSGRAAGTYGNPLSSRAGHEGIRTSTIGME
eukprot:TRINITY_DN17370_c0_g1::TRINITY_DN17370_c0_g1_i1::g.17933::m.17933 TRINITY_DN17370_c0_g1::TRINITY_DN17370_c0_g1_i1::g.17933  ORF type:complete len:106 (+),score=5.91 TRINITY_DN17370_c0_g1_i1:298-615(+)